ncbi:MAG: sulfotransferase [Gammaproteobacteria bacterium]|nr:sulfotransferase [Gammaproteobacteria bacterium]
MRKACTKVLELAPDHADAHFLLGIVYASAARYPEALDRIGRAVALAPERADYLAQQARCLIMVRRDAEAREAAERALALEPRDALALDTVGVVLSRTGVHDRAAEAFRRAVALRPDRADFHYNLGTALRIVGDFSGAERALERAVALEPRLYKAHSVLAELRTQTPERNHIDRLSALLATVGDDVDGELHLRHALAKELEDLGDYAAAFAHLAAGKARKRATLDYSFETDRALFDSVRATCTEEFLARAGEGWPSDEPIFVVGLPRTGTTLVERILSSHSKVQSAGELGTFALCLKRAAGTRTPRTLDPETIGATANADFAALGRAYLESTRPITGEQPRFVDKTPLNFFLVGFIAAALPNARIVCVRRGALDSCVAIYRRMLAPDYVYYRFAYDLLDIGRYYVRFDALMRHWRRLLQDRFYEIRYESLIADPRGETERLLGHLGLDWEEACLEFERNPAPVATASAVQVREPLNAAGIGRWRRFEAQIEPLRIELERAGVEL